MDFRFAPEEEKFRLEIGQFLKDELASDWEERREWARRGDRWSWEHFRFFWADVAVELDGGRCRVYALTFRQEKTSAGWSALAHWGTAESFEMLLDKVSE